MIELLVEFVKYLLHEESIQGTVDEDDLLREYAAEFLTHIKGIRLPDVQQGGSQQ